MSDGVQKAIRFPPTLYADIVNLADHDDRDFAPYVRRVMQDHVEEKRAENRAVLAS